MGRQALAKSTLAFALRSALDPGFHYYASDQLADAGFRPSDAEIRWAWRESFFYGFHASIAAFASAGLDLLVEHIVEEQRWAEDLERILFRFNVFWVGVHAPIWVITRREKARGNRPIGEAVEHLKTHSFCRYDIEVDTTAPVEINVEAIVRQWNVRQRNA